MSTGTCIHILSYATFNRSQIKHTITLNILLFFFKKRWILVKGEDMIDPEKKVAYDYIYIRNNNLPTKSLDIVHQLQALQS